MYAVIKDNEQLLINRLDNNEAVILKGMISNLENKDIKVTELTGETGDFDGILLSFKEKEEEVVEDIVEEVESNTQGEE